VIKGVIFDIGGVLARDVWEGMYADIARRCRLSGPALHRIGLRLWAEYDRRAGEPAQQEREYWEKFRRRVSRLGRRGLPAWLTVEWLMENSDRYIRAVDAKAARRIITRLKTKGLRLAICSNNVEFWFPRQFYWLGLDEFFDLQNVVLSCHEGCIKGPGETAMFRAAARRLGLAPGQCLMIDDREPYLSGAALLGMPAILFKDFAALDRQLRKLGL
jgi:HAD superfamily hydrolase (TIGR01509 family)